MKAVVMAGGFGSRLYPLTVGCPKPMVPLVNKPVLAHILKLLKYHNFSEVILTVRYLANQIQDYFGDGHHLGMTIHYAVEDIPLGTAGGVKNAQPYLDDDPFLVISGDALTDIDLSKVVQFHREKKSLATLALKPVKNPSDYGVVVTDDYGRIKQFVEKPKSGQVISKTVNTGIYVLEPEVIKHMEPNMAYDFSYDIFPDLLNQGDPFFGYVVDGYWCDIGTLQSYTGATFDALSGNVHNIELGNYMGGGIWADEDIEIASDVTLYGPIYLGNGVKIDRDVTIYGPAVIGHRTVVDRGAFIERSIIGKNCLIGEAVDVHQTIVPEQSILTTKTPPWREPISEKKINKIFPLASTPLIAG